MSLQASLVGSTRIKDETRKNVEHEVWTITVRFGMKSWQIKRKYVSFINLEKLLRANVPELVADVTSLPVPPPTQFDALREKELIELFLAQLLGLDNGVLDIAMVRQFFEVPNLIRGILMDSAKRNPNKSSLNVPLLELIREGLPDFVPKRTDLFDVVMLGVFLACFLPLFVGVPEVRAVRITAACLAFVLSVWYFTQREGLLDYSLEMVVGLDNVPVVRSTFRVPDLAGIYLFIGVGYGVLISSHASLAEVLGMSLARLAVIGAAANMAFLFFVAPNRKTKM